MSWSKPHWKPGDICTHVRTGNWYVVREVGSRGGCSGPCFYGPGGDTRNMQKLRACCERVAPSRLPDKVIAALAVFSLTGLVITSEPVSLA
jgi:hypothetical protein